jgi:hypothetical protein
VVIDDVEDLDQVLDWWPRPHPPGRVLATTRQRKALAAGLICVDVDVFTEIEAHAYLHAGTAAAGLVARGRVEKALVDQGFKNQGIAHGAGLGIDVETVLRNPQETGFVPQPKRWRVEQTYGILILHRRLVRDYEHRRASSASRVYWAMTHVVVRRLPGATRRRGQRERCTPGRDS